uniref:Uncharacterized protein n=1 Tax=Panagrolaimus sp. PS1159 TaxID=55785 RepID=A0AC35G9W3_9BILA
MAKFGIFLITIFSVITFLNIYVSGGPIGDRSTTTTTVAEGNATVAVLATTEIALVNETGVIDTLTTEIDVAGGNETHIRQKRSCGCCCCRPCCCGCGGCGCCGCGGGRKRRAIQELSHKLMNKNVAQFTQQNDSSEIEESEAAAATTAILEAETTTPEATKIVETTTLAAIRKMTNAKIDSFGRRQF